ncbi:hypothetical protein HDU67_002843, partial [Dinochytrium kinnereticum]
MQKAAISAASNPAVQKASFAAASNPAVQKAAYSAATNPAVQKTAFNVASSAAQSHGFALKSAGGQNKKVKAIADYNSGEDGDLTFRVGDLIAVLED